MDFEKFKFDQEETSEIFSLAPSLVVDRPPPPPPPPRPAQVYDSSPPVVQEEKMLPSVEDRIEDPTSRLKQFWQAALKKGEVKLSAGAQCDGLESDNIPHEIL